MEVSTIAQIKERVSEFENIGHVCESIVTAFIKLVQHKGIKLMLKTHLLSCPLISEIKSDDTKCHFVKERWQVISKLFACFY